MPSLFDPPPARKRARGVPGWVRKKDEAESRANSERLHAAHSELRELILEAYTAAKGMTSLECELLPQFAKWPQRTVQRSVSQLRVEKVLVKIGTRDGAGVLDLATRHPLKTE